MKLTPLLALCLALPALHATAVDPVVLEGPAEATKAEIDQCAAALGKRFVAIGVKNLKAAVVEKDGKRTVEVTSAAEIAPETRAKISTLSKIAGAKGVLKDIRNLTPDEKAKGFDAGKRDDPKSAKAPPGTSFAWCVGADLSLPPPNAGGVILLLCDNPFVPWSEVSVTAKGADAWTFKLSPAATKRLALDVTGGNARGIATAARVGIAFDATAYSEVIDIKLLEGKTQLKEGTFMLPAALAENLDAILRNPMPRALKPAEAKK